MRVQAGDADDGVQAGQLGGTSLAETQWVGASGEANRGSEVYRRHHGESGLMMSNPDALKFFHKKLLTK